MPRKLRLSRKIKNWKRKRTEDICSNLVCNISIPILNKLDVLRKQIQSYGDLPLGWVLNTRCTEYIQLCNFQVSNPDAVLYSLKVKRDFSWLLFLCGQKVISKDIVRLPTTIDSVNTIVQFITMLEQCFSLCIGNPDAKFEPLAAAKKGIFTNAKGSAVIAEVEKGILGGQSTIRHKSCEFVLSSAGGKTNRCSHCTTHRKSLLIMLKRSEESTNSTNTASTSHANYRYLPTTLMKRRARNIRNKFLLAQRKITRMKNKIAELKEKDGVTVSNELGEDLKHIMCNNFAKVADKHPPDSFQRVFWEQHSKAAGCKDNRAIRWHPAMIRWCLYLRHLSGKAYDTLRNSGVLQLPSQRTLRDYTHYVPATIGYSSAVDKMLIDTLKVKTCPPHHLYVTLLMDEMHIKEGLVYNKHSGELVGFVDLGDMNNHIMKLEKTLDKSASNALEPLANSMLVLMVRGLLSGFQFPYAQFPCASLKGEQLHNIFWEAVQRLERLDIKVLAVTCDGCSVNRRFLKLHSDNHKMPNPFSQDGRYIFFISDPPHLVKTVRNCWASQKRNLWCNGKAITWQHLVQLYKSGTGADRVAPGLSLIPKLKFEHIYLTSFSKMRVDLAAQVLSESVSSALRLSGRNDLTETSKFVSYFDKFFDALNVTNLYAGKNKRKPFQQPYTSADDFRLDWLEKDFLKYLEDWEKSVNALPKLSDAAKYKMQLSRETLLGIRITTRSFIELVKFIFTLPEVKFFLSEKISQDPIEKFFGCQRQRGSTHQNPNAYETCKNTQALRVINTVCRNVSRGNTRGNTSSSGEENIHQPLMKRRKKSKELAT